MHRATLDSRDINIPHQYRFPSFPILILSHLFFFHVSSFLFFSCFLLFFYTQQNKNKNKRNYVYTKKKKTEGIYLFVSDPDLWLWNWIRLLVRIWGRFDCGEVMWCCLAFFWVILCGFDWLKQVSNSDCVDGCDVVCVDWIWFVIRGWCRFVIVGLWNWLMLGIASFDWVVRVFDLFLQVWNWKNWCFLFVKNGFLIVIENGFFSLLVCWLCAIFRPFYCLCLIPFNQNFTSSFDRN